MGVSLPTGTNGFVAERFDSLNRANCKQLHNKADLLRLNFLKKPELNSSKGSEAENNSDKWWENVTFEHGHVAEKCRPDFPPPLQD